MTIQWRMETQKQRIDNIRSWARRKKEKGLHLNADEVWAKIRSKYPTLKPELQEEIFNRVA